MLEYQGWATIKGTYNADSEDDHLLQSVFSKIKSRVNEIASSNQILGLRYVNGIPRLWALGFTNHKSQDWQEIYELFEYIAKISPSSYGILSFRDDEDPNGNYNEFQIYVLRRGEIIKQLDPFLSPCVPIIEDN